MGRQFSLFILYLYGLLECLSLVLLLLLKINIFGSFTYIIVRSRF